MLARLRCLVRGHHSAERYLLGGFRCRECGAVGGDLTEMGFENGGYVPPMRRVFSRQHRSLTVTDSWDTGRHSIR